MAAWILDRDRFAKCRALMERGATPGERAAGRAAAARVAAAAGLSLADAVVLAESRRPDIDPDTGPDRDRPRRPAGRTHAGATSRPAADRPAPEPVTVEEVLRQKAADAARRKRAAARARRRPQAADPDWERWSGEVREAQAARDRDWAQRRPPRSGD